MSKYNILPPEQFIHILENRQDAITSTLADKAVEYSFEGDRLYNFNRAAEINNERPAQSLWGMATKHLVSVMDLVEGRLENTEKNVNDKCGDLINYICLLEAALLVERESKKALSIGVVVSTTEEYDKLIKGNSHG